MSKKIGLIESAMKYRQIVFLVISLLAILGVYALINMPRQEFPTFTIRQGLVVGIYPGATSAEVEQQLTTQVERYLFSYKEVKKKKTYSYSKDGLMVIYVELNDDVTNADEFWSKLKHGLNTLKMQLPQGVLALTADNDFGDTSALLITLESDNKTYRELETYLNNLEDKLRRIESVSKLRHYGFQKEQITIYLEKNKLEKYGISPTSLMATLFSQGYITAGGSIDNGINDAPVHISSLYKNEDDIAEQIIYTDPTGHMIRLKDVASVVREYPQPDSYIKNNGKKCLLISMEMLQGNNIVQYGHQVDKVLKDFQKQLPDGVTIKRIADQPKVVGNSITDFLREFLYAIIAVILVTMILLPLRVASVAASSIPISIFISLGIMYLFGMELNTVTLAGLIIVLGMIVDNSVVIVDSYMERLDHGVSRWYAAISSAKAFLKAIVSATLAISVTFFPFLFTLKGQFRDFVLMFPWTVTITLGISLLVAMLVIPFLEYYFVSKGFRASSAGKKFSLLDVIQNTYEKMLHKAFAHPRWTLGVGLLSVVAGVLLFRVVPQRLMPVAERDQFAVEIYLPQGSALHQTEIVSDSVERILKQDERVTSVTAFIGTSSPRFHTSYAPNFPAKNYAQFIVNTTSAEATVELLDKYSKYSYHFPNAYVRFKQLDFQAVTTPVEVRISGDSLADLKQAGDTLMAKLRSVKGLTWVHTNFEEMLPVARVNVNSIDANRLGISKTTVASNLAMRFGGLPMTTLWENDYPVDVKLKTDKSGEQSFSDIENEYIHSFVPGVSVPLRQFAKVNADWEQGQIVRRNGVPTISVMADVERDVNVNDIFPEIKKIVEKSKMPENVIVSYGGAYESDAETLPQILSGLIISIFIIFLILLFHFRKINLALLVLSSSLLSLFGAVAGVIIFRSEFGLTSVLGIVSLIGIIVRNGIIMLDYAEDLRLKHKESVIDAAIHAGQRRMRPIFLTSAAASMGVIPMIISKSPLWSPMGTVICFGTITSMVLIVLILPVAYWLIFRRVDNKKVVANLPANSNLSVKALIFIGLIALGGSSVVSAQKSYTLDDLKKLAISNNAEIKNATLEIEASQQVKATAFTKYFPTVDANVLSFRTANPLIKANIPSANLPVYNGDPATLAAATQYAYFPGMSISLLDKATLGGVQLVQPLFAGGRIYNGNKLASLSIDVNNSKAILSKNEVSLKTEQQYWQIVSLNEKMKTLLIFKGMLDSLYRDANNAYHAGLINRNDVLKVSIKQSELKMNRIKLENGIKLAGMALCQYAGVAYDSTMILNDRITDVQIPSSLYVKPEDALPNRQEYALLAKSVEAEKLQTKLKRGEYMPEVGVGVSEIYQNMTPSNNFNTMAFVSLKVPISGWWEGSHSIKERHIREQIAQNNQQNNQELLTLQIQQSWNELDEAYQQIEVAQTTINQAEDNLKVNRDNLKAGLINISDVLEAQGMLQQSQNQLTDALFIYKIKMVTYLQATGRY
jgi:multidrug efflux pump subunit AcrB/outer membrane protein TolC